MDLIKCPKCGYPIKEERLTTVCPECGKELGVGETLCRNCGYDSKPHNKATGNSKAKIIKIASVAIACLCLILSISRINNDKYNFYKQHYKECMAGYEENSRTANGGGFLSGSYRYISNSYKDMADSDMKEIWKYRIQAILFVGAGVVVLVVGNKIAKKKEE